MDLLLIWFSVDFLAADYFGRLMRRYNIPTTEVRQLFLEAVHRYLLWAGVAALAVSTILGGLLTNMTLRALTQIVVTARKIGGGNYSARARADSSDEVGQLAVEFNRMAESLERMERQRKNRVLDVSHELRIPLTNVRGYLEALRDGVLPASRNTFESLHEETLRLITLSEDLLGLSRAEIAHSSVRPQPVDLRRTITQALELFHSQLAGKSITIETQFDETANAAAADPDKLAQVLRNLLQNAVEYTPRAGRLRIATESIRNEIKVTFATTGDPIAAVDLPFIFDRFYRGEKSLAREHGSAGLGLSIVKELIEAHGGRTGVERAASENRIWFTLPR
ncbi:MAG: sensor histidine kinase [Bryobacteraceae bacterium]